MATVLQRLLISAVVVSVVATAAPTTTAATVGGQGEGGARIFEPGVISSGQEEYRITFTPNGRTAYFARSKVFFPFSRNSRIMVSHLRHGEWSAPKVAPFSGRYPDIDPFITRDGSALYFSSIRPVHGQERQDADLWRMHRKAGGGWGKPQHLGAANSPADDLFPSVTWDGTVYFGSDRPGGQGGFDVWASDRRPGGKYGHPYNLGSRVNSELWEFNPAVIRGGRLMVFTRLDPNAAEPFGELHITTAPRGRWTQPRKLGRAVNTPADEYHPSFSPDRRHLYFVRRDPFAESADGDIYVTSTRRLLNG